MRTVTVALLAVFLQGCASLIPPPSAPKQPSSRLVLAVDAAGRIHSGSKGELENAVRAGHEIQVGWALDWDNDNVVDIEHWAEATFATLYQGEVFAQQPMIVMQRPKAGQPNILLGDTTWVGLISTTGFLRGRFQGAREDSATDEPIRVASWWYVRE